MPQQPFRTVSMGEKLQRLKGSTLRMPRVVGKRREGQKDTLGELGEAGGESTRFTWEEVSME